jgi:hypothetical protein
MDTLPAVENAEAGSHDYGVVLGRVDAAAQNVPVVPLKGVLPGQSRVSGRGERLLDRGDQGTGGEYLGDAGPRDGVGVAVVHPFRDAEQDFLRTVDLRRYFANRGLETGQGRQWRTESAGNSLVQEGHQPVEGVAGDTEIQRGQSHVPGLHDR